LSHYMVYEEKATTRCFVLSGKPGVGKTHFVKDLVGVGKDVYYYRADPMTKKFWDGYTGQDVCVIDDLGHYSANEWSLLIQLMSDTPVYLPMVSPKLIEQVPFVSSIIFVTTNCLNKLFDMANETMRAVLRRVELLSFDPQSVMYKLYNQSRGVVNVNSFTRVDLKLWLTGYVLSAPLPIGGDVDLLKYIYQGFSIASEIPYLRTVVKICSMVNILVTLADTSEEIKVLSKALVFNKVMIPKVLRKLYYMSSGPCQERIRQVLSKTALLSLIDGQSCNPQVVSDLVSEGGALCFNPLSSTYLQCEQYSPESLERAKTIVRNIEQRDVVIPASEFVVKADPESITFIKEHYGETIAPERTFKTEARTIRQYRLVGNEDFYGLYKLNEWGRFIPFSDKYYSTKDESDYKPYLAKSIVPKRKLINELKQRISQTHFANKTAKRRLERKRQSSRM